MERNVAPLAASTHLPSMCISWFVTPTLRVGVVIIRRSLFVLPVSRSSVAS
jgi:hypothetical protein